MNSSKLSNLSRTVKFINDLQDPHLVSAFQNYFGIHRVENCINGDTSEHISSYNSTVKNLRNGVQRKSSKENDQNLPEVQISESSKSRYIVESRLWYYVFSFGTSLGYELFYATFFPFWVWNLNAAVCRRVVNVWVFIMYVGQVLKDIICWPRPPSPPVVHLEPKYVPEYGMPSTHAMVSVALPFSFWYFTSQRYDYPFFVGLLTCLAWCILVCCSRLYMGMHTVLDVIAGIFLAPILMLFVLPFSDIIDKFQQTNAYSPLVTIFVMLFFQKLYPHTGRWSPARGDTSVIMGTGTGFAVGTWLNYRLGFNTEPPTPFPLQLFWPSYVDLGLSLLRIVIGLLCIVIFRTVLKSVTCSTLCFALSLDPKDPQSRRKVGVEIPSKFITYIGIGMVITFIAPALFQFLHIERDSMYAEV